MTTTAAAMNSIATWEQDIRAREEAGQLAFLAADTATLDAMWDEEFLVNSPLNIIQIVPDS